MQGNFTNSILQQIPRLALFSLFFLSCVYFNTFYNAETSYQKALQIIEESPILEEQEIPSQAKKLLGEAIENSQIVLKKYSDSKYADDAIFIIGKASFLRDEVAVAERNFKKLLRNYPNSEFYLESEIWLIYTQFRMGLVDSSKQKITHIYLNGSKDREELYLIHNILAEIAIEQDSTANIYNHYELAAQNAISDSKKTATFGRLVKIAEERQDIGRASFYLIALGDVAPDKIRIDSKMQWITYQRELGNYDEIIDEIESMLGLSEFAQEYMQLELELGKVYMDKGDLSLAKELFSQMVEQYSKKDETAEAYYHLGYMALINDFNMDLAKEYFENSKSERSQSKYGKESRDVLKKIDRFENLESLYKELIENPEESGEVDTPDPEETKEEAEKSSTIMEDMQNRFEFEGDDRYSDFRNRMQTDFNPELGEMGMPEPHDNISGSNTGGPDSVLFMIGEMLLYDFSRLEHSLEKFKTLAEEYPHSQFAPQALYVLSHFEPDQDWRIQLNTSYPNSAFINPDSAAADTSLGDLVDSRRDYAWTLAQTSYEDSYNEFKRLYIEEQDTMAAYIGGFISDYYLHDIIRSVENYQTFVDSFPDHSYSPTADDRLQQIKTNLETQKEISQQGIAYQEAVLFLQDEFDVDSVKVLLSEISSGEDSRFRDAANQLKSAIRDYTELKDEIHKHSPGAEEDSVATEMSIPTPVQEIEMDSLIYHLAKLLAFQFEFSDSANLYHSRIVDEFEDSKFRPYSLLYLADLDPGNSWHIILAEDYPDTTFAPDSTIYSSVYLPDIFLDDFTATQDSTIQLCDSYLELFPEPIDSSLMFPDSTGVVIDSSGLMPDSLMLATDTTEVQLDSINFIKDSLITTTDTTTSPFDPSLIPGDTIQVEADSLQEALPEEKGEIQP